MRKCKGIILAVMFLAVWVDSYALLPRRGVVPAGSSSAISTANDYLYAIDETNNLGYFVTDRRQPAGLVCIYVFMPNKTRKVYQSEDYTEAKLRSLAAIERIADTWNNQTIRQEAITRLKNAKEQSVNIQHPTSITQTPLDELRQKAEVLEKALNLARNYYARANETEKQSLRQEILQSEEELEKLLITIKQEEKKERNAKYQNN